MTDFLGDIIRQKAVTKIGSLFLASMLLTMGIPLVFSQDISNRVQLLTPLFSFKISIDQASLKDKSFNEAGVFYVNSTIKNIRNVDVKLMNTNVWHRYILYWVSDNPKISPSVEARKPYATWITLKPNEETQFRMELVAHSHDTKEVNFRLGYVPNAESPISVQSDVENGKAIIWSNAVTLPAVK